MLIHMPDSLWSQSIVGFAAPAYTPVLWLVGISWMADSYYFERFSRITYSKWHYVIPSIGFSIFHITHSVFVYIR